MNHTTSLEVSKRLKEAGYEGESQAAWYVEGYAPFLVEKRGDYLYLSQSLIPAYTLGELIRELPFGKLVHTWEDDLENDFYYFSDGEGLINPVVNIAIIADTPEDAAGLALEALLKKGKTA